QAEDGIRDWSVTGVQTCALPILFSIAFFVVAGIVFGLGYVALRGQIDFGKSSLLRDGLTTATTIVTYVILILGYSAIYQVVVKQIGRASCRERVEMSVVTR